MSSIRARLLVSVAAIQIVGSGLATYLVVTHEQHQSYIAFDARLGEQAEALHSLVEAPEDGVSSFLFHREFMALPQENRYSITDSAGRRIASSKGWPKLKSLPVGERRVVDVNVEGIEYRALILSELAVMDSENGAASGLPTITLVYAAPIAPVEAHIRSVEMQSVSACLALLLTSMLMTAWALDRGLRPLRHLASNAEEIDVGRWTVADFEQSRHLSELRPLAESLTNLVDRLHAAFDREGQFFADAAHEMKSSIAIVCSTLQFALQAERTASDYRVELIGALEDTDRLQALVGSMFDLARIESNRSSSDSSAGAEVHAQVQRAMKHLQPLARQKGVHILTQAGESEVWVGIPEEDLFTVLANLVENAIVYSDTAKTVTISVSADEEKCRVIVADQGCGMAQATLPHIYERFYRVDVSRARATGGVGLGLSIVRALVLRAGGTISVQSELGEGSVFEVALPIIKPALM